MEASASTITEGFPGNIELWFKKSSQMTGNVYRPSLDEPRDYVTDVVVLTTVATSGSSRCETMLQVVQSGCSVDILPYLHLT